MRVLVLLLCVAAGLAAQSVEGTVVNRVTGGPVDGAKVMLYSGGKPQYETTTDARGAFRIENLKPASYNTHIEKKGFIPGPVRPRAFQVIEGGQPVTVSAQLLPMGKVSGRVLDADGKAVRGAMVQMLASFGGPSKTTDGNGNFSFEELGPATYTLSARPPDGAKAMELDDGRRLGWIMTYYPGVAQRSAASRITVNPASEIYGQDIRLISAPVHRIRGVALDPKGDPLPRVAIELADTSRLNGEGAAQVHSADDGVFEFRDVAPGDWRLTARALRDGAQLRAFQSVPLGDRDLDRLELRLSLPFAIQGTVVFEGEAPQFNNAMVLMAPAAGGSDIANGRTDENGKFTAEVYPGVYQVVPVQPGPQFYLSSIRLGQRESMDGNVEFSSSALPLTVTFRSDGGTVRGTVEDCGAATIVLMPENPALRRRPYVRDTKCGANSGFQFTAIRPGEYLTIALDPTDPAFNFMSTDLNQAHLNAATRVTVRPNESTQVDLKVAR